MNRGVEGVDTLDATSGASTLPGQKKRVRTRTASRLSLVEGVDTLDATIKIQTQEEGFSKSSLNLM